LTLRIYRSSTPDAIVFALSGDMDLEHVARLPELLANETVNRVTLDLKEVTFADRAAVQFLVSAEAYGIRIVNCPRYVRSWIAAETESQPQRIEEQDK
jgi:anti-anti-sigma regulatory factor